MRTSLLSGAAALVIVTMGIGVPAPAQADECLLDSNGDGTATDGVDNHAGADAAFVYDLACGFETRSSGGGVALGYRATSIGTRSVSIGPDSQALARSAVAIGNFAIVGAEGINSIVLGRDINVNVVSSVAIGNDAVLTGAYSVALGGNSVVSASNGTSLGQAAQTSALNAVALGSGSLANQENTVSVGHDGSEGGAAFRRRIVNLADGVEANDAVTVGQLAAAIAGVGSTGGSGTFDPYFSANSTGKPASATGTDAIAIGSNADAGAENAIAVGAGSSATGTNSVALGSGSIADQANTISVGSVGNERRIVNVAAGVNATDAVNVAQLNAVGAAGIVNTSAISANTSSIATNVANIADNTAAIDLNAAAIADNSAMLDNHDRRLMALEAATFDLGNTLARFDDEIDGSTAVAIAMSGNAFLPDQKANITSNMGVYNGALAGSLQIGVLVSEKVAVNAGVATGFNKGGKTAARVGFTLGL